MIEYICLSLVTSRNEVAEKHVSVQIAKAVNVDREQGGVKRCFRKASSTIEMT